jgi:hypothetical protein
MDNIGLHVMKFKHNGYCCAQIVLIETLKSQVRKNPQLVWPAGGLCFGIGTNKECQQKSERTENLCFLV